MSKKGRVQNPKQQEKLDRLVINFTYMNYLNVLSRLTMINNN